VKANLGTLDKRIRLGAGIVLILVSVYFQFFAGVILGVYALLTGLVGWCPFDKLFGIDTTVSAPADPKEQN